MKLAVIYYIHPDMSYPFRTRNMFSVHEAEDNGTSSSVDVAGYNNIWLDDDKDMSLCGILLEEV